MKTRGHEEDNAGLEFPPDRVAYFENLAQAVLDSQDGSREFYDLIKNHENLVKEGDRLLCLEEGTGYNIILNESDMPLTSNRRLIFYNNHIGKPHHFGLLLADLEMELANTLPDSNLEGIISFGKKASKVLFDGSWDLEKEHEKEERITYIDSKGDQLEKRAICTVETVLTFSPRTEEEAAFIARFLVKKTDATIPGHIQQSWYVPDIRATLSLAKILAGNNEIFRVVTANLLDFDGAQLLVLRQKTKFDNESNWKSHTSVQNQKLAQYLASQDFNVLP